MKTFNFYKEDAMKEVDIIIESPVRYEEAKKDIVRINVGPLTVPVISIKKLIKMKEAAGRLVDAVDVVMLKKIQKLKRGAKCILDGIAKMKNCRATCRDKIPKLCTF